MCPRIVLTADRSVAAGAALISAIAPATTIIGDSVKTRFIVPIYWDVFIRRAKREDALAVARVHVRSWQAAYRGLMPDDYLDGLRPEERAQRYDFSGSDPEAPATLVAVQGDTLIGFATVAPAGDADAPHCGELCALYVDPGHLRRGVGTALLQAALTQLREKGYRDAVLWMLTGNQVAHHFYSRNGWTPDETGRRATVWGIEVDEVRYRTKTDRISRPNDVS